MHLVRSIARTLALALALAVPSVAVAESDKSSRRWIGVLGSGEVEAAPDIAQIRAGVVTEAPTAAAALTANNRAMEKVLAALRKAGVAEQDLQTESMRVSPRYRPRPRGEVSDEPQITGYTVQNRVSAVVRKLDSIGDVLDVLVREGANQIDGIQFLRDDPAPLLEKARKRAMTDARRRAQTLASAEGVTLGPVLRIEEIGGATPVPRPMMARMAMESDSVPVAPGSLRFQTQLQVRYAIAP